MAVMTLGAPRDNATEVNMIFNMFDQDGDGRVSTAELKRVLQSLDKDQWTDARVESVVAAYDKSCDGELQLTEFWGWICGHGGGKATPGLKTAVASKAASEHDDRCRKSMAKADAARAVREAKEAKESQEAWMAAERSAGRRKDKRATLQEKMAAGLSEKVARELVADADVDGDGDVDEKEWQWVANEKTATVSQIRGLYQKGAGEVDMQGNLSVKELTTGGMVSIIEAFGSWDQDGSGAISFDELLQVLRILNPKLGEKTAQTMRKDIDTNGDGEIDILEFVRWLSGGNRKKKKGQKKPQDDQEAVIALALHRKRATEARQLGLQAEFELAQHDSLAAWIKKRKFPAVCHTLMTGPGARQICMGCHDRHAWVCHGCGFLSYFEDCVNGCNPLEVGWTCVTSKCLKQNDGSKKSVAYWQKNGFSSDIARLGADVRRLCSYAKRTGEN